MPTKALQALQTALTRIYLDDQVRMAALAGCQDGLADLDLSDDVVQQLLGFVQDERKRLQLFSDLLASKREKGLSAHLPVLKGCISAARWEAIWQRHRSRDPLPRAMTALEDAMHLVEELVTLDCGSANALEVDAVEFERARLLVRLESSEAGLSACSSPTPTVTFGSHMSLVEPVVLRTLHHCPRAMLAWVSGEMSEPPRRRERSLDAVFFPQRLVTEGRSEVRVAKLSPRMATVLRRCDGSESLGAMFQDLEGRGWDDRREFLISIRSLVDAGVLASIGTEPT